MKLLDKVKSKTSNVTKYIFQIETGQIMEVSYINKSDGKDIICVPTQTSCVMQCKFCHITDIQDRLVCRNLSGNDIFDAVSYIVEENNLNNNTLLVSYMGLGEPLLNVDHVINSMARIQAIFDYSGRYDVVRFGLATSMPTYTSRAMDTLIGYVNIFSFDLKIHFSLHYTCHTQRKNWMPKAEMLELSIYKLREYANKTYNKVEVHYALIDGVNDTQEDAERLREMLTGTGFSVKFLFFNEKPTLDAHRSNREKMKIFTDLLDDVGIESEYYIPPGLDIGASCGQFIQDSYLKYNSK